MAKNVKIKLKNHIPLLNTEAKLKAEQYVKQSTLAINTRARLAMAAEKRGRIYGNHQASAPGEAPAVDTGMLTNSLDVFFESDVKGTAYTPLEYAEYLEYGTIRMRPRPFYIPAAKDEQKVFVKNMKKIYK
jgi:HK97 gp10 family phage protein